MYLKFLLLLPLALLFNGCSSSPSTANQKNTATFIAKIAAMNITASKIKQVTTGPFYNHTESATGLTKSSTGFGLIDVSAEFNIPVPVLGIPLLHWELTAQTITGTHVADLAAISSIPTTAAAK